MTHRSRAAYALVKMAVRMAFTVIFTICLAACGADLSKTEKLTADQAWRTRG